MNTTNPFVPASPIYLSDDAETKSLFMLTCIAFLAILRRDLIIAGRNIIPNLMQSLLLPIFLLFIFGRVLTQAGATTPGYGALLLPGMIATNLLLIALMNVTLPLVLDIGNEREMEDRLLAPLPVALVAFEKVIFAAGISLLSGILVFPIGYLILGNAYQVRTDAIGPLFGIMLLSACAGASLGLLLGTAVKPEQINIMNGTVITPMMFTGCTFFAWGTLSGIRWFQIVTLFNPLTYSSEGLRALMVPPLYGHTLVTLDLHWVILGLSVATILFLSIGIKGFIGRVVR